MNNREQLIELISNYKLERREVAELVRTDRETVDRWLLSAEGGRHLEIPDMAIELLRLKLAARERPVA
ncbi:MAG: hypothetical protein AB7Q81_14670 [Gammaproteobacteria bacterium]